MSNMSKEEYEILAAFRYALRRFLRTSETNARNSRITPQQYLLLLAIKGMKGREWATISELAERLQILHHAAVGLCARAEQIGLIKKTPSTEDRRQVYVSLTEKGEKLLTSIAYQNRREMEQVREDLLKPFINDLTVKD